MTVCIAAKCRWRDGNPAFIICADTELSGAGKDDSGDKLYRLGHNLIGLIAGDWSIMVRVWGSLRKRLKDSPPRDEDHLFRQIKKAGETISKIAALH
jgi:hypothetical protein